MEKENFIKILREKQRELGLTNTEFAKYLGKNRSWINNKYCSTGLVYPLRESTMQHLNKLLGIPYEVMEKYNQECRENK